MIGELWKKLLVTEYRCSKNFRKLWRRWDNGDRYSYFIRHLVYFFDLQHGYFSEYFVAGFENTCQWWILELILNWFFNVLGDHRQISRPILTHFSPIFRFYTSWKRKKVSEKETEHWAEMCTNPLRPIVAFNIETNHLFCPAKQRTGFYMKCNTELKWVNSNVSIILKPVNWLKMQITRMFFTTSLYKKNWRKWKRSTFWWKMITK